MIQCIGANALIALVALIKPAIGQDAPSLPGFEELEAAGAVIGEISIDNQNIFDLDDPKENNFLFRLANKLHIRTRPSVIRRTLLFKSGDLVSVQLIEETERLLRANKYIYEVRIRPIAFRDGVVDIEVTTRDSWTLDPGLSFSRTGGENNSSVGLKELNILGTGMAVEYQRSDEAGVSSDNLEISNNQLFGTRGVLRYNYDKRDDGDGQSISLARPFYALDARWTAGGTASTSNSLISSYTDGILSSQYQLDRDAGSVFGGWSKGLIEGWTRRYTLGVDYSNDSYNRVDGQPGPAVLPKNEMRVAPFIQFDMVEDNFQKLKNRDQIERAEFFRLGFRSSIKLGYAATALGSTRPATTYAASISNGFEMRDERFLVVAGSLAGVRADSRDEDQLASASIKYYVPQSNRALTFYSLAADVARDADASNQLTLGGSNGLPGFPRDYQSGEQRVLLNVEQRLYSDWYPFRLFRVGGAVFFDAGRAWGGTPSNTVDPGWLSNFGFGLRIFSVRSAFGTVWHLDFAFPLNPADNIADHQILVQSKTSF